MAASATFALKPGVWFRRGRLLMASPDSMGTACPLSGRNSTYRPVQISGTGSTFEDGTRAFEQLAGAKSVEQAIEIQSQYAKKAYENHIAQMTKLGEMYVSLTREAFKPIQDAVAKATQKVA